MAERQIFFACGAPKSGTTWLQRVLDAHPRIQCSGEGHFIERFSVPISRVVRDYADHMALVAGRVYEGKPYYPPLTQDDFDGIVRGFILQRLMARSPGPEIGWIGDKTPRYTHNLPALLRLFPDVRIVNIVRDPRDVAIARMHQARRAGIPERVAGGTTERIQFIREGGTDWARCVAPVDAFAAKHPGVVHTLKYEEMLADPTVETRRIFGFLGADQDDALVARVVEATSFEALSGRKPGEEHPTAFLRKGVAGDWVGQLEPDALAALEETCGDLMRLHGYE
jgi:hypothetical protein